MSYAISGPFDELIQELLKGININDNSIFAKKLRSSRFQNEKFLEILLSDDNQNQHILFLRLYSGFGQYYRPWVEFFGINYGLEFGKRRLKYLDSDIESILLERFSKNLPAGGKLHVVYEGDPETTYGLTYGIPTPITRLGYLFYSLGFTWFKDWYFPEGGSEGGQKLQGEKPINHEYKIKHLNKIKDECEIFIGRFELEMANTYTDKKWYLTNALERAKKIMEVLNET